MTVKELIRALSAFPADMPVVVDGYEGGADNPQLPKLDRVTPRGYDASLIGIYDDMPDDHDPNAFAVVRISR